MCQKMLSKKNLSIIGKPDSTACIYAIQISSVAGQADFLFDYKSVIVHTCVFVYITLSFRPQLE